MIEVSNLTLKYPSGKGIFDVDFSVEQGEVMGYLGPNGAGKTTTIRAIMGFMKADKGKCTINGLDCFDEATAIKKMVGYLPGEVVFPAGMKGNEVLKYISEIRGTKDLSRQKQLLDIFEFDPSGDVKKFSKGMKQKLGLVVAFMHNPDVLLLDEPTSGLDPLMQGRFIDLILQEKKKGRTILMSSHMFEEIERTCDNVLIIKDGRIAVQSDIDTLKNTQYKGFIVKVLEWEEAMKKLSQAGFKVKNIDERLEVLIPGKEIDKFAKTISQFTLLGLDAKVQSLEEAFMHFYSKEGK